MVAQLVGGLFFIDMETKKLRAYRLKEYLEEMKACASNDDFESAHLQADDILVKIIRTELGCEFDEVLEVYDNVGKWYS